MPKRLLVLGVTAVVSWVALTSLAGSTQVDQFFEGPFPDQVCGVSGMSTFTGPVAREGGAKGSFFGGTFWQVFVADNGKSITFFSATPNKESSPMIDEQAGTVTFATTFSGLPVKVSITKGPTLIRDAGTGTFIDVFEYTGDPEDPVGDHMSTDVVGLHGLQSCSAMPTSARSSRLTCSIRKRLAAPERTSPASAPSACVHIEDASAKNDLRWSSDLDRAGGTIKEESEHLLLSTEGGAQSTNQSRSLRRAPAPFWLRPARPRRPSARGTPSFPI